MLDKIESSNYQLLIDNKFPNKQTFESLESSFKYSDDNTYLGSSDLTDTYLWLEFSYGKTFPHPNEIYDEETSKKIPNPRLVSQFEPNKQLFVLILFEQGTIFISNQQKKKFIETFLSSKIKKKVSIKGVFKSLEEFYEQIKTIDKIIFSSVKRNLFSSTGSIQQFLQNEYAMEEPEEFSIEALFHIPLGVKIKNTIKKLLQDRSEAKLKKVIIQGLDDQGFEHIFNEGNFINKAEISTEKNSEGLFIPYKVRDLLLEKLNG